MSPRRPEDHPDLDAMTTNERLFNTGLLGEFDAAIRRRDGEAAVALLRRVRFEEAGARNIVTAIFADPRKYGYGRPASRGEDR